MTKPKQAAYRSIERQRTPMTVAFKREFFKRVQRRHPLGENFH